METQKYTGRNMLLKRLTEQVKGNEEMARGLLIKRGHMNPDGTLTAEGIKRNAMTAEERAKDRAAKASGGLIQDYTYNPQTNRATRR